jgi:hypothetical protein
MSDMVSSNQEQPRFAHLLEYHLNVKLQSFVGKKLQRDTMSEMYLSIKHTIDKTFSKSSMNPTTQAKDWLAQQYYETIRASSAKISDNDPLMWDNAVAPVYVPVDISSIPSQELMLFAGLFNETIFAEKIDRELRNR